MKGKVDLKAAKEDPQTVTVDLDTSKGDVGDVAKAVAGAKTPHAAKVPPFAVLVVDAPGLNDKNADKVDDALKGVKGVDAKASKGDVKGKMINVSLDANGGAKLADIKKALAGYAK